MSTVKPFADVCITYSNMLAVYLTKKYSSSNIRTLSLYQHFLYMHNCTSSHPRYSTGPLPPVTFDIPTL
jgi:hypothetical protein